MLDINRLALKLLKKGFIILGLLVTSGISSGEERRAGEQDNYKYACELAATGKHAASLEICDQHLSNSQNSADEQAKWLLLWSQNKASLLLRQPPDQAAKVAQQVVAEIDHFLVRNSEQSRAQWLRFQAETIELSLAQWDILAAHFQPANDAAREQALARMVHCTETLRERLQSVKRDSAIADSVTLRSLQSKELKALTALVASRQLEAIMSLGDLFAPGSKENVAAASDAVVAAHELLQSIPPDADGRKQVVRQYAESLRRTGQLERAETAIAPLLTTLEDLDARAIAARIAIDNQSWEAAARLLQRSSTPGQSPSLDFELTQLRFLLVRNDSAATKQTQVKIADQIESIGNTFGVFAKRRAEAMVLDLQAVFDPQSSDPRLTIAQGAAILRRDGPKKAGEWLAASARATTDSGAAVQIAIVGAAVLCQAEEKKRAADLLRETAITHFENPAAVSLHLQAATLIADRVSPVALIEHLQECTSTWPGQSVDAAEWLARLLDNTGDQLAAILLTKSQPTISVVQAKILLSEWQAADTLADQLCQTLPTDLQLAMSVAQLFSSAESMDSKRIGLRRWNAIAQRLQQGSPDWFKAKRAAIELLHSTGEHQVASQLEAYIKLTQPAS